MSGEDYLCIAELCVSELRDAGFCLQKIPPSCMRMSHVVARNAKWAGTVGYGLIAFQIVRT